MDEYEKEVLDLEAQVQAMVLAEEDKVEIRELSMQLEILRALYRRAQELMRAGEAEPELKAALTMRGFGEWNLDNVYAFVYESSVDLPGDHHSFLSGIEGADFADLIRPR
ncbi:MAG TPA: hypothetical protein VNI34_05180 [Candidatus Nitrosotalea sp.]|nr:hypothetical protein [Candidatus Nitrosotalea sp.]